MGKEPKKFGLSRNRGCTDILCLILFIIFFLGLIAVGAIALMYGDIRQLLYPTDSQGNICGVNNGNGIDYTNKKYLLFYNFITCLQMGPLILTNGCPTEQVCVASCPTTNSVILPQNYLSYISNGYCVNATNSDTYSTALPKCPSFTLESTSVYERCLPSLLLSSFTGNINSNVSLSNSSTMTISGIQNLANTQGVYAKLQTFLIGAMGDIMATKYDLLIFTLISVVIALIFVMLLRCFAGIIICVALLAMTVALSFGTYFFIARYYQLKDSGAEAWPGGLTTNIKSYGDYYNLNLTIGCIFGILLGVLVLVILGCWKNIRVAIQLLKETSKAMGYVWGLLFWSLIPVGLLVIATVFCAAIAGYLQTMGSKTYANVTQTSVTNNIISAVNSVSCDAQAAGIEGSACRFVKYGDTTYRPYLLAYDLFMWFWLVQFIDGINICVIAGSFSGYYWALNKPKDIPVSPVLKSLGVVTRYHLGSVAFGSLIIAIVKFIRAILEYISYKLKKFNNKLVQVLLIIMKCCFWCLEKFLKFLTQNAYIQMMIYGKNFCFSAKDAFSLIIKNIMGKLIADFFAKIIIFLFVLSSMALTVLLAYVWFIPTFPEILTAQASIGLGNRNLSYGVVPVVVVGLISFITSRGIFQIFSTGVATLFLCYLHDLDKNDGTADKPYYMSKNLMKILGKNNKPTL